MIVIVVIILIVENDNHLRLLIIAKTHTHPQPHLPCDLRLNEKPSVRHSDTPQEATPWGATPGRWFAEADGQVSVTVGDPRPAKGSTEGLDFGVPSKYTLHFKADLLRLTEYWARI